MAAGASAALLAITALTGCASSRGSEWAQMSPAIPTEGGGVVDLSALPSKTDRD